MLLHGFPYIIFSLFPEKRIKEGGGGGWNNISEAPYPSFFFFQANNAWDFLPLSPLFSCSICQFQFFSGISSLFGRFFGIAFFVRIRMSVATLLFSSSPSPSFFCACCPGQESFFCGGRKGGRGDIFGGEDENKCTLYCTSLEKKWILSLLPRKKREKKGKWANLEFHFVSPRKFLSRIFLFWPAAKEKVGAREENKAKPIPPHCAA